ncbi:response regulator transcription factor [Pseudomonas chlororaphis]|uniref:Response regulator transcription factor n=1 Tax=Pseudomonas chlororaphis subsp. aurantiaca TaxID=86192 RepID=A0AAJ0ZKC0_9PSED|nr:response regulator transcription factor [Pseudomonas chlororaphis]MBU4634019.1 response regulator transcription factor [Pseudomonas chlororaphis subsp. aurantiaca]
MKWSVVFPLRIAVLDDHSLIQLALKLRLSREADFKVVGVYSNSQSLLAELPGLEVDLLILDYALGDNELDGLNLLRMIRRRYPELLILISSSAEKPSVVNLTLNAGASGFFGKSEEVERLIEAVRKVAAGEVYISPLLAYELGRTPNDARESVTDDGLRGGEVLLADPVLSPKEQEVLRCCLEGMSVSQIAHKFSRSMKTISGQKQSAFRKLGVRTDAELFKLEQSLKSL